jgi:lycopene beta-cyclase
MGNKLFDIAIIGGGCSGLQLLHQLSLQLGWSEKRVALFDDGVVKQRSWCFWGIKAHPLQHIVSKSWKKISFKGRGFSKTEDVSPYTYNYIAGEDFFKYFQEQFLPKNGNIEVLEHSIEKIYKNPHLYTICNEHHEWSAQNVYSSLPPKLNDIKARFQLKQHFKGWFVKTEKSVFDDSTLTLMDFSIPQHNDTRFIYILPFSDCEALIEMTVFSPEVYPGDAYETVLHSYMQEHYSDVNFSIVSTETGAIPMTDALFSRFGTEGEVLLGTAAGMVKPSTGYAFKRITNDSQRLAKTALVGNQKAFPLLRPPTFGHSK